MASREIHEVFREIASDQRFKAHQGLSLGRGVADGVLIWEIQVTDLDFDADALDALRGIADREGLALTLNQSEGIVLLRQRPNVA